MGIKKRALITGITGQDGGHLAKLVHEKGYEVFGIIRGQHNPKRESFVAEFPYVNLVDADLTDQSSLIRAMQVAKPNEVYNLAAISHVGYSFKNPQLTSDVTGRGVLFMLESIRLTDPDNKVRFYQASTSEMFGGLDYNRPKNGYNEDAIFHPRSPYGVAKLYGYWITRNYRESYKMFAVSGILFNHEGERRGIEFVTRKITNAVARIKLGLQDYIELGDLWPKRDWGYAGDYVEGMWRMLQQKVPKDYVLGVGAGVTTAVPAVGFLVAAAIFVGGYLPVTSKFSLDIIEEIEQARDKIIQHRNRFVIAGLAVFMVSTLAAIYAVVINIGVR